MIKFLTFLSLCFTVTNAALNVKRQTLTACSSNGEALTGFERSGKCMYSEGDEGSHHICIDMPSDFCSGTGQGSWCTEDMPCHEDQTKMCPIGNWCVCEWAFASYLKSVGGCANVAAIDCDATNEKVVMDYQQKIAGGDQEAEDALECLKQRSVICRPAR